MNPSGCITTRRGPSAPMCSQMDADPGPPLNANVSGRVARILTVQRVGHEKHFRFNLAVGALDGKPSRGRGVLERLAADRDLMMRHYRRDFGHVEVLFFVFVLVAGAFLGRWLRFLRRCGSLGSACGILGCLLFRLLAGCDFF